MALGAWGANNSIRTAPLTFKNVAAPNSGRAKSLPQGCDDSLRPITGIPFCRWYIVPV
jgi:hypothetical protein